MATLVFSYAHADEDLRNELEVHLTGLKRQGLIEPWHDRRILAGQDFAQEIDRHFASADVVLLLVSPDFIASNYCFEIEMKGALERHVRGEAVVIPVILRPCDWQALPFGRLQAATRDGKAIVHFPTHDDGFLQVVRAIKAALAGRAQPAAAAPAPSTPAALAAMMGQSPAMGEPARVARSSNLRIARQFSDLDRDRARRDAYDYIAGFFENSLAELKARNTGVDINFERIDSQSFEASVYREGNRLTQCGIWTSSQDRFGGDIVYSRNGVTRGSFNESLSIHADDYTLGLKPLGISAFGNRRDQLLSNEGAAEMLWNLFIEPLQ